MKQLIDHIKESYINENEVDELFKRQDEIMKKMIERWKKDDSLKPLDNYFKWKSHEISTAEFRSLSKQDIMDMMNACRDLQDNNYNDNAKDPKDWFKDDELASLLDAVEMELINIYPLYK